jgi:putative sterol carrier protein
MAASAAGSSSARALPGEPRRFRSIARQPGEAASDRGFILASPLLLASAILVGSIPKARYAMSLESATAAIRSKAGTAPPLGHRILFDLGIDGVIFWDGTQTPAVIDNTPHEAETTITMSSADLDSLIGGGLNPTMAYMTGRLKIQGSMGVALKMSQLLED